MIRFLQLVVQNGSFILFLILQTYCIYQVIQYNQRQKDIYIYSSQKWSNSLQSKINTVNNYFSLRKKNDDLAQENANLLTQQLNHQSLLNTIVSIDTNKQNKIDSGLAKYHVLAAKVINNSVSKVNNTMTLDKGSKAGVLPGMGVVGPHGVVGIVTDTSEHFSLVMSLLHTKSKLSVKLKRSHFFGTLSWKGRNPEIVELNDIQKYADLKLNDTIVTSGFSIVFPEGLPIGTVDAFQVEAGGFSYSINVKLFENLSALDHVYLINHLYKSEKNQLENLSTKYE